MQVGFMESGIISVSEFFAWTALMGILNQVTDALPPWFNWAVFGVMLCLTPFYVCYLKTSPTGFSRRKIFHIATACLAFVTWVFAMGNVPFNTLHLLPVYGSVALIVVTLIIPVLERFFTGAPVIPPPANGDGPSAPPSGPSAPSSNRP
jgi:hypothetical protein